MLTSMQLFKVFIYLITQCSLCQRASIKGMWPLTSGVQWWVKKEWNYWVIFSSLDQCLSFLHWSLG